ncbi:MAG: L,D-transpeptidase/peptidoglycan binding protein [Bacillota bacterium]|nr:L,D-transpeptidase/peptidoglycan binding protein [Bacillota bacterium]
MKITKTVEKIFAVTIVSLCAIIYIYLYTSIFFIKHLYIGSEINGIKVSGKTVEEAKAVMTAELQSYSLNIKEREGKKEQISSKDIGLKYKSEDEFTKFKKEQNPLKWGLSFFSTKNSKITVDVLYDKEKLNRQIDKLTCITGNIIEPQNPSFKYKGNTFVIIAGAKGNKINKDILMQRAADAISKREKTIDLEAADCYVKAQYNSKSQRVVEAKDILNKYVSSKITYTFGDNKVVLDGSTINQWLTIDENYKVALDEGKVKAYVESLANTYNTVGKTRSFHTSSGNNVNIDGGDYGWQINVDKELQDLCEIIKGGQTVNKEPAYSQTTAFRGTNDIGNCYVEIDISRQHLWFYKNGSLVVEGSVVTGNLSLNHGTPAGVYKLKYKERDATLKGPGYSVPVSFWMPFNEGIGLHDATWRWDFGGDIYKTNGSHGCVNLPYNLAQTIFNNVDDGTPVVCYY